MKKLFLFLLCAALCAGLTAPAMADLIWPETELQEALPDEPAPETAGPLSTDEPVPAAAPSSAPSVPTLAIVLVAAVVVITVAVIFILCRKKKETEGPSA